MILDNGCKRNVGGSKWHESMRQKLRSIGLKPKRLDIQEDFLFGSDRVDTSICAWMYPVGIHGHTGLVNVAEISSNCPGLMSSDTMGRLDISLHTRRKTYDIGEMNVWEYPYELSDSGHALLRTDWYGDLSHLDPNIPVRKGVAKRLRRAASFISKLDDLDSVPEEQSLEVTTKPSAPTSESSTSEVAPSLVEPESVQDWTGLTCVSGDQKPPISIMEICTATGRVTQEATNRGWKGLPSVTLETGFDLTTKTGIAKAWEHIYRFRPDVIVMAWPCDPLSS